MADTHVNVTLTFATDVDPDRVMLRIANALPDDLSADLTSTSVHTIDLADGKPAPTQPTTIKPGQTLIIRYTRRNLSEYEVDQLKAKLTDRLPGVNTLVLGRDLELTGVYDPDEPEQD